MLFTELPLKKCSDDFLKLSQILYYGVRVPTTLKIIKSPKWTNPLWTFWYAGRDFVETHSVFKQFCRAKS